ncbi:hypothetical protein C8Q80DRAFT_1272752 [Daedaleopsis nitida]|nr:hypothetical protein C8Q80DRAFT_1272752 [Daedaleopsis nitida]
MPLYAQQEAKLRKITPGVEKQLVYIRLLGYMLIHEISGLDNIALAHLARNILSTSDIEALSDLGEFYKDHLIRPFRKFKGSAPTESCHSSRPSSELSQEEVREMLAAAPADYSASRKLAMQREGYRCIVAGIVDNEHYIKHRASYSTSTPMGKLELSHIFSQSINTSLGDEAKHNYIVNAWSVLHSLGYMRLVGQYATADKVHSMENVMMMESTLHDLFDKLYLWFEPVEGIEHEYRVVRVCGAPYAIPDTVQFRAKVADVPLPDPESLRLHAAVCRISWLSGVSGLFQAFQEDLEEEPDGATDIPTFARSLHARLEHLSVVDSSILALRSNNPLANITHDRRSPSTYGNTSSGSRVPTEDAPAPRLSRTSKVAVRATQSPRASRAQADIGTDDPAPAPAVRHLLLAVLPGKTDVLVLGPCFHVHLLDYHGWQEDKTEWNAR